MSYLVVQLELDRLEVNQSRVDDVEVKTRKLVNVWGKMTRKVHVVMCSACVTVFN